MAESTQHRLDRVRRPPDQSRGHEVPEAILGPDFDGILVVDGWSAYDVLSCQKGRCHGHILRRCRDLLEGQPGPARPTGAAWKG